GAKNRVLVPWSDAAGVPVIGTPSSMEQATERYDRWRERGLLVLRGCAPANSAPSVHVMVAAGLSTTAGDFRNGLTWPADDVRGATALTSIRWGNRPASLWTAEDFGCCASG